MRVHLTEDIQRHIGRLPGLALFEDLLALQNHRFKKTVGQFRPVLLQLHMALKLSNFILQRSTANKLKYSYQAANGNVICKVLPFPT